jgi:hypothetical protein
MEALWKTLSRRLHTVQHCAGLWLRLGAGSCGRCCMLEQLAPGRLTNVMGLLASCRQCRGQTV